MFDFNEVFLKEGVVFIFLSGINFVQIVLEPTHIKGRLLDQIYFKDALVNLHLFLSLVKSAHFSDHEPVFVLKTLRKFIKFTLMYEYLH